MRIEITTPRFALSDVLRRYVERRLDAAVGRLLDTAGAVLVGLDEEDLPGAAICVVEVATRSGPRVSARGRAAGLGPAVDEASRCLREALQQPITRRGLSGRGPVAP